MDKIHMKFIDDMTVAESIHLKEQLIVNPDPVHPLQYHERTGHILPMEKSQVQSVLDELQDYTEIKPNKA